VVALARRKEGRRRFTEERRGGSSFHKALEHGLF
jgi:hypothetical protein